MLACNVVDDLAAETLVAKSRRNRRREGLGNLVAVPVFPGIPVFYSDSNFAAWQDRPVQLRFPRRNRDTGGAVGQREGDATGGVMQCAD
jgi:hypothetical protein